MQNIETNNQHIQKKFEYPEELQEKLHDLEAHMMQWSGEQDDFGIMWDNYDDERNRYSKENGRIVYHQYKHLLETNEYLLSKDLRGADMISIETFLECKKDQSILEEDGRGYYATKDQITDIPIIFEMLDYGLIRKDFEYIAWFGR